MRTPRRNVANRPLQLLSIVQPCTEHHLRMILHARRFEPRKLSENIPRPRTAQHLCTQDGIRTLHRYIERGEMQPCNTRVICLPHVGQCHKIPIEKGQAVIVVLYGKTVTHVRGNHIDKAEIAVIRTRTNPIEYGALKLYAKLLVIVLVKCNALLRPIGMFNEKLNLLVRHRKTDVNNIAQQHIVDRKDLIPRRKPQLIGKAPLWHAKNHSWICLCHSSLHFIEVLPAYPAHPSDRYPVQSSRVHRICGSSPQSFHFLWSLVRSQYAQDNR